MTLHNAAPIIVTVSMFAYIYGLHLTRRKATDRQVSRGIKLWVAVGISDLVPLADQVMDRNAFGVGATLFTLILLIGLIVQEKHRLQKMEAKVTR